MENKKNKYGFIVLVEVLVVLLFILKLHNNLDECCAIDDAPYYWLIFDYTGKPNLPEMIKVTKPGILGTKKLFAETDYEFADNASENRWNYRIERKRKISWYDKSQNLCL